MVIFAGEITIVGPPLSSLDAELAFRQEFTGSKEARKQAQMNAAAQEARGMLGQPPPPPPRLPACLLAQVSHHLLSVCTAIPFNDQLTHNVM